MWYILSAVIGVIVGGAIRHFMGVQQKGSAENESKKILAEARRNAETLRTEAEVRAKKELLAQRETLEAEIREERVELKQTEKRLTKREDNLDRKVEMLDNKEQQLRDLDEKISGRENLLEAKESEIQVAIDKQNEKLEQIAQLNKEEARKEIIARTEKDMEHEIEVIVDRATTQAKEVADEKAQHFIANAIGRLAVEYTTEHVVSTVELPNDDMKGRIIGREGRNIRAFESATGIDVIVDDTPGVVVLSGFDPVRREIAGRAISKLVADGRIHPARIEEVVGKTREEMEKVIEEIGKNVALEVDVRNLKPREIMLLGRLQFRTSYGQNQLDHSREVAFLSSIIASQMGLDETLARRCGLLHDIGKAADHEEEGTHPEIGTEIAKRCGEPEEVIDAIRNHHGTTAPESVYTVIVQAADAISAARPGARRETLEKYVKRLERLEAIATSYPHIEKAFAIQAGRELRVIVNADKVTDASAARTCREVAKQIEEELTYPGEVKVTMIREYRITEYAR